MIFDGPLDSVFKNPLIRRDRKTCFSEIKMESERRIGGILNRLKSISRIVSFVSLAMVNEKRLNFIQQSGFLAHLSCIVYNVALNGEVCRVICQACIVKME